MSKAHTEAQFGLVQGLGGLLDLVPELNQLVNQALEEGWTSARFQDEVENSHWWNNHSATARSVLITKANDPATYQQNFNQAKSTIEQLANQLGMKVTPLAAKVIASHALLTGNNADQAWLTNAISHQQDYSRLQGTGGLKGGMAATVQQLQSLAAAYGYHWSPTELAVHAQHILDGTTTLDTFQNRVKTWAKSTFPSLSEDIDAGHTVADMALPYVQSMSQLLEISDGQISLYTPVVRKALQGVQDPKTKERTAIPVWQFEDEVRKDPRWQYTQNAKDTTSDALLRIGAAFGFGPEG